MTALQPRLASAARVTATRPPTLLVVDDDDTLRVVLTRELCKRGFDAYSIGSGTEAVEMYCRSSARIDVVLMDVNMPGMSGPDALAAMRAADPDVRCCFMTADLRPDTHARLLARGAAAVLGKPFDSVKDVCDTLRRLAGDTLGVPDAVTGGSVTWRS